MDHRFDHQELESRGGSPKQSIFAKAFEMFVDAVSASLNLEVSQLRAYPKRDKVGLLLSEDYKERHLQMMEEQIRSMAQTPVRLPEKPMINGHFLRLLDEIDWLVADIGCHACINGIIPYLHGCFVPMMRLIRISSSDDYSKLSPLEESIYGEHEVGYPKDIIRWSDDESLERGFTNRLATLYGAMRRISTAEEAYDYFRGAALRKETVFVSYSGKDESCVRDLTQILKKRFQRVFDYRDKGASIVPGRPWMEEIFVGISTCGVAVPMLSKSYVESGNCLHEGRELMALRDAGKVIVVPIKLCRDPLELPLWMQDTQYLRLWDYAGPEEAIEAMILAVDRSKAAASGKIPF
jgi:hypothetical protein